LAFWQSPPHWRRAGVNTLRCLVGCSLGDLSTLFALTAAFPALPVHVTMPAAMVAGITTSVSLETVLLKRSESALLRDISWRTHSFAHARTTAHAPPHTHRTYSRLNLSVVCFGRRGIQDGDQDEHGEHVSDGGHGEHGRPLSHWYQPRNNVLCTLLPKKHDECLTTSPINCVRAGGVMDFSSPLFWASMGVSMAAGFVVPLPYNYFMLRRFGKSCH
jgi:hypothetical protein